MRPFLKTAKHFLQTTSACVGNQVRKTFTKLWPRPSLDTEIAACLPVFEVLEKQIHEAVQTGNHATDEICRTFGDMSDSAACVVHNTGHNDPGGVSKVQSIVSDLLEQFSTASKAAEETLNTLLMIEENLAEVEDCLSRIEYVAGRSRLVSMNGQIEASRAGDFGQGFSVVASETGQLATHISETSHVIRTAVTRLTSSIHTATNRTREFVMSHQQVASSSEAQLGEVLTDLAAYQSGLLESLGAARKCSDQLSGAVVQAVVGLQFQDAVSQRMCHVAQTLNDMRNQFGTLVTSTNSRACRKQSDRWLKKLAEPYTVADERSVHAGAPAEDLSCSDNVELF